MLGLEVVLADGTVMDCLSTLRKDNTGLDLNHLFIGSEGTLGIITKIALLAAKKPNAVNVAVLALNDYRSVLNVFQSAKKELNEVLSAFEFWDASANQLAKTHLNHVRNLFDEENSTPFYVLIETQGSNMDHDSEKMSSFLESLYDKDLILNGVLAQDESQILNMWALREGIPEACSKSGIVYKYDIR